MYAILRDKKVIPITDVLEWAIHREKFDDRIVKQEYIGKVKISMKPMSRRRRDMQSGLRK